MGLCGDLLLKHCEDVRGTAEGAGPVQPGEEEAEGGPHHSLQLPCEGEWRGR